MTTGQRHTNLRLRNLTIVPHSDPIRAEEVMVNFLVSALESTLEREKQIAVQVALARWIETLEYWREITPFCALDAEETEDLLAEMRKQ